MVAVPNDINQKPDLVFETDLLGCDLDNAPSYKWQDRTGEFIKQYIYAPNKSQLSNKDISDTTPTFLACYTVCTLVSDLSKIPLRKFIKVTNSRGKEFYRVLFQLKMTIEEVIDPTRLAR